jgi:HSP20 family protein
MARETAQDKRPQSRTRNGQNALRNAQTTESGRKSGSDRQTPIQTSRDESRVGVESSSGQQSRSGQHVQQSQQNQQTQQSAGVARRGLTAPVRGGASNPFAVMQRMAEDMDRLFEQFGFGRAGLGLGPSWGSFIGSDIADRSQQSQTFGGLPTLWAPQIETVQRDDHLVVRADLPGVNKDDVHVEVDNGVLTISGERRNERNEEREGFYRSERSYGQFFRAIPLPDGVQTDQCEAKFNDGVLEITLPVPKHEEQTSKRIQIR